MNGYGLFRFTSMRSLAFIGDIFLVPIKMSVNVGVLILFLIISLIQVFRVVLNVIHHSILSDKNYLNLDYKFGAYLQSLRQDPQQLGLEIPSKQANI